MRVELATWRPLLDVAAILFVLGMAGALCSRDRASWWLSQGLLLLSVLVGFATVSVIHAGVDLFSLGVWVAVAWGLSGVGAVRTRKSSTLSVVSHD